MVVRSPPASGKMNVCGPRDTHGLTPPLLVPSHLRALDPTQVQVAAAAYTEGGCGLLSGVCACFGLAGWVFLTPC